MKKRNRNGRSDLGTTVHSKGGKVRAVRHEEENDYPTLEGFVKGEPTASEHKGGKQREGKSESFSD